MAQLLIPESNRLADFGISNSTSYNQLLPELWRKGVQLSEATENFFQQFEGPSDTYAVQAIRDLSKGAGSKITFRTMAQLFGEGVQGDELVQDKTEDFRLGSFQLTVDFLRHAVSYNKRTEEKIAIASELKSNVPTMLGNWLGRVKTERLQKLFLHKGNSENYILANTGATTEDDLLSGDTISYDTIIRVGQQLKTRGAKPAMVATNGKNKINRYLLASTGEALVSLKNESNYLAAVRAAAAAQGESSVLFTGGYVDVDGHVIREYNPIDHDGFGPIGSSLNARAVYGGYVSSSAVVTGFPQLNTAAKDRAAFEIAGGGSVTAGARRTQVTSDIYGPAYFKYFNNFKYRFNPDDSLTVGGSDRGYVLILSNGKYTLAQYSTNDGNRLTLTAVLGTTAVTSGSFVKSLAGWKTLVTGTAPTNFDAQFADSKIHDTATAANAITPGAVIIQCNKWGVPLGKSIMMGANAAVRGYGSLDGERSEENFDGEFVRKVYVTSIFGQSPYQRPDGRQPNYVVLSHAVKYAGLVTPAV
jgi:N4-gp56 family major capsid protein